MSDYIYLDHAATTPIDPRVLEAMLPYLDDQYFNPSAQYLAAKRVRKEVEAARASIAHWLGGRPIELTFTAGGTEANNLAIHGLMSQFPEGNIVVSSVEHDAVLEPAAMYDCRIAPVKPDGRIDLAKLEELIDDKTVMVSVMYANNELGTIQPIKQISQILEVKRAARTSGFPLYFHTDACQASAYLDLHATRLGVDMITINASKIYGPKQIGALYVRTGIKLEPLILGGGQERNLRSGTENVAAIIGFAKALDIAQTHRNGESERLSKLQQYFIREIADKLPTAIINGSLKNRLPNNVHVTFPSVDNERLMMQLDENDVLVAVGSACSASSEEPSHVLSAIGLTDDSARSSLRLTMGHSTDRPKIDKVVSLLVEYTKPR